MTDAERTPWEATLEDMESMAAELDANGWETLSIVAGDTAAVAPDAGPEGDDRFGLVHVVQGDDADRLEGLLEGDGHAFASSEAYVAVVDGTEYVVTVVRDPDRRTAVLIAGAFEYRRADDCFEAARREGAIYTHLQRLDGTHVAAFEHDDPTLFEPPE